MDDPAGDVAARGGRQRIPRPATHRPGGPPPWSGREAAAPGHAIDLAAVRAGLAATDRGVARSDPRHTLGGARPAAVLLVVFEERGEARIVLTKRPETMPSHQGEIAFPGGKHEPGLDADLAATALREANEEIGLDPATVEIVAELDTIGTVASRFTITPFVGLLAGRPHLVAHPREVTAVFDLALSDLLHPAAFREERWGPEAAELSILFYEIPGETIWGATARILTAFLNRVTSP